jgi:hypothetical protein
VENSIIGRDEKKGGGGSTFRDKREAFLSSDFTGEISHKFLNGRFLGIESWVPIGDPGRRKRVGILDGVVSDSFFSSDFTGKKSRDFLGWRKSGMERWSPIGHPGCLEWSVDGGGPGRLLLRPKWGGFSVEMRLLCEIPRTHPVDSSLDTV